MRNVSLVLLLLAVAMSAGCSMSSNTIPQGYVGALQLGNMSTNSSYEILGPAEGTSKGGFLFGFIPLGMEKKFGSIGPRINPFQNPVQAAAVYNAIESVPDADMIVAPRFSTVSNNYLVYREDTVTVKGKAVRFVGSMRAP
jgi:hypothetical protein